MEKYNKLPCLLEKEDKSKSLLGKVEEDKFEGLSKKLEEEYKLQPKSDKKEEYNLPGFLKKTETEHKPLIKYIFDLWLGKNPLIMLDTSAIIEIENMSRKEKSNAAPVLQKIASHYPVIITKEVMNEVEDHNKNNTLSRKRKEISDSTYEMVKLLRKKSEYLEKLYVTPFPFDDIRYLSYWKCKELEKEEELKGKKEPRKISDCDYNLISESAFYSLSLFPKEKDSEPEPLSKVLVISQDGHIKKGLQKMVEEGYEKLLHINMYPELLEDIKEEKKTKRRFFLKKWKRKSI